MGQEVAIKNEVVHRLREQILSLQGFRKPSGDSALDMGLGVLEQAFPAHTFPTAAVHEFISHAGEEGAATNGFIAGLTGKLMRQSGACLWISSERRIFPPALAVFGVVPQRIIFADLDRRKDVLWAMEEALKCETLSVVVAEVPQLSFRESRRLQLAVERSRVTGFIHRRRPQSENTVACVTRWKIRPLPGFSEEGMPGVGFPRWEVQLAKVRNGSPGTWKIQWSDGGFQHIGEQERTVIAIRTSKTG